MVPLRTLSTLLIVNSRVTMRWMAIILLLLLVAIFSPPAVSYFIAKQLSSLSVKTGEAFPLV